MRIYLSLTLDGQHFSKTVDWPAVPRMGDEMQLTDGGWSEPVERVWWPADKPDGAVQVELGTHRDTHGEDLADSLRASGWT